MQGSSRSYPNPGNASKGSPTGGPGGTSYPGKRASPKSSDKTKSQSTSVGSMPPKTVGTGCFKQRGSKRDY